jgi:nucleoside-diphosphate-sugar epimerase
MVYKRILVLGGSGFIGRELIKKISNKITIFVLDKKKINLNSKKNIKFLKGNIGGGNLIEKLKNIETVFFLIGKKGGPKSINISSATSYIQSNTETLNFFLKNFKNRTLKKIIFLSSEHVYGDEKLKIKKVYNKETFPKNYYGLSKLLSEKILYNYQIKNKISVDVIRFPRVISTFGENFLNVMVKSAIYNKKIIIKKTNTKFNFIYIDDLISAMVGCLKKNKKEFNIFNVFNNSKPNTLLSIAREIKK